MGKGFFESDEDYAARSSKEAAEKLIEEHSGSAPSRGFFEDDKTYISRIQGEADALTVKALKDSTPSRGFFEDQTSYRDRLREEADRAIVEAHTGGSAAQGFLEEKGAYRSRLDREANEALINERTGQDARPGFFEDKSDYARRVRHEANIAVVQGNRRQTPNLAASSYSAPSYSSSSSSSFDSSKLGGCLLIVGIVVISCVVRLGAWVVDLFHHSPTSPVHSSVSTPITSAQQGAVLAAFNNWVSAHQANDINAEADMYGMSVAPYYASHQATHEEVQQKLQRLAQQGIHLYIFNAENIAIRIQKNGMAQVTFDRLWSTHPNSPPHRTKSQLKFADVDGRWLVVGERDVP